MTQRGYFGKYNSTLGSVVPLAMFSFQEEEIRKEEERRESTEREEAEFVKSVRETGGGVIGLVNKTNSPVTFTSLRLLMERSQVKENR